MLTKKQEDKTHTRDSSWNAFAAKKIHFIIPKNKNFEQIYIKKLDTRKSASRLLCLFCTYSNRKEEYKKTYEIA
jgi:hypothetical protein